MLRRRHPQTCILREIFGKTRALQSEVIKSFMVVNFGKICDFRLVRFSIEHKMIN